jgi:hypothetical protein
MFMMGRAYRPVAAPREEDSGRSGGLGEGSAAAGAGRVGPPGVKSGRQKDVTPKMLKTRRLFGAARLLPLTLAVWSGAAAAQQDTNTVGSPQLRDFSLPGTRTPPPVQTPPPAATPAPRATAPATTAPARQTPTAASRAARPAPQREVAPPRAAPVAAPPPAPVRATPQPAPTVQPQPQTAAPSAPVQPQPQAVPPPPAATPAPEVAPPPVQQSGGGFPWLWLLGALVVLGGGAFLLFRRRRVAVESDARDRGSLAGSLATAQWLPAEEPAPQPIAEEPTPVVAVEPEVAPATAAPAAKRAVIEVDIRPERASAMEDGTLVQYALVLTNIGEVAAGNIRIDGRMFNASADGEVDAFFAGPIHEVSGSPQVFIKPGESISLQGQIGMKREELHAIEVQGRVIFVPLVAINVAYDWEGGGGRTSTSWLVGRTPSSPEAKMGAFRLDLGPRIYRQVDRREARKALV